MPFGDPFTKSGCIVQVLIHGKGLNSTVCWALPQTFQKAKGLVIAFLNLNVCFVDYVKLIIHTVPCSPGKNASELLTFTQKFCVELLQIGHSIDLLGHIVFQSKLGTERRNGKQQVLSTPQGHILFQSKLGTERTNWQVTNVVVDLTRSYIISK
jgi:hypothetical protein